TRARTSRPISPSASGPSRTIVPRSCARRASRRCRRWPGWRSPPPGLGSFRSCRATLRWPVPAGPDRRLRNRLRGRGFFAAADRLSPAAGRDEGTEPAEQVAQREDEQRGCDRLRANDLSDLGDAALGSRCRMLDSARRFLKPASDTSRGGPDRGLRSACHRVIHACLLRVVERAERLAHPRQHAFLLATHAFTFGLREAPRVLLPLIQEFQLKLPG